MFTCDSMIDMCNTCAFCEHPEDNCADWCHNTAPKVRVFCDPDDPGYKWCRGCAFCADAAAAKPPSGDVCDSWCTLHSCKARGYGGNADGSGDTMPCEGCSFCKNWPDENCLSWCKPLHDNYPSAAVQWGPTAGTEAICGGANCFSTGCNPKPTFNTLASVDPCHNDESS